MVQGPMCRWAFNRVNRTNRCACFRLRCRRRQRALDAKQVLQHLWTCLSFLRICLTCLSHRFPFQENSIVLDSVASVALPSNPSIDDLFSRSCAALSKSSNRSTAPCSPLNLARPGERISLSNPLALPGAPIQNPQGCRTTLPPRGSSAQCTADLPAFAECPEASRLQSLRSPPSPLPTPFPRPTSRHLSLQDVRARRRAPKTRVRGGFPGPLVSTEVPNVCRLFGKRGKC